MEQSSRSDIPSLLPYLQGTGQNGMTISLVCNTGEATDRVSNCASFVTNSSVDPLSKLFFAQLRTDAGTVVKNIILLSQQDQYHVSEQTLWPLNNVDIDNAWQELFLTGSKSKRIELSCQSDSDGRLHKLSSLFFCSRSRHYFIPPCPACGSPLLLCCDDELLKKSGLSPYSTTLKRYLYCPSCCQNNSGTFYAYESSDTDPVTVKDRWGLIHDYKTRIADQADNSALPCATCSFRAECADSGSDFIFKIIPLFFFPTGLLIIERPTLAATQFLPLLSGMNQTQWIQQKENEKGHSRESALPRLSGGREDGFYFRNKPQFFLEILYLKLSFLGEVVSKLRTDFSNILYFRDLCSIERIWVDVTELANLLPTYWTFNLSFIDIFIPKYKSVLSHRNISEGASINLGVLWFEALLVNERLDKRSVISILESLFSGGTEKIELGQVVTSHELFHPENIFWDQHQEKIPFNALKLWERVLILGASLLQTPDQFQSHEAFDTLYSEIHNVSVEIRESLFNGGISADSAQASALRPENKEEIVRVLALIKAELQAELEPENETCETVVFSVGHPALIGSTPPAEHAYIESNNFEESADETCETVILPAAQPVLQSEASSLKVDAELQVPPKDIDETCETVVLPATHPVLHSDASALEVKSGLRAPPEHIDETCETVILAGRETVFNGDNFPGSAPARTFADSSRGARQEENRDDLTETVVLSSSTIEKMVKYRTGADVPVDASLTQEDEMDATMILPVKPRISPRRG